MEIAQIAEAKGLQLLLILLGIICADKIEHIITRKWMIEGRTL
ncbi:hypothetical protein KIS4809_0503 [Bacillus sp. ZZV12-4809]|nr:hypothetical protein KIS4809_0503 [Bacillus sp. ZZV12-4809]